MIFTGSLFALRRNLKAGLCLFFFLTCTLSQAQYFQFSQYNFTGQRINPALIGTSRYASAELISRTQKTGGDFNINSNFVAASYPLVNASTGRAWSGIGISLMDDRSGGIFSTQAAAFTYAMNVRINRYQLFSFGVKALYQSQRINPNGFYTGSQYVPDRGFDSSISSGENFVEFRKSYSTFSTGIYWQKADRKGNLTSYWGLSLFDFNKPDNSFLNSHSTLASTFILHGGFEAYKYNTVSIFPEVLYTGGAGNHTLSIGARFQYALKSFADRLDILTKYVPGRSGIVGLQFHRENFSMGLSYDFPAFVSNAGNLGAVEIGIAMRGLVDPRLRRKRKQPAKNAVSKNRQTPVSRPKSVPKKDSVTIGSVKKDSVVNSPPPQIDVVKTDSLNGSAKTGKIISEPFLVEKITLRFQFQFNSTDLDYETETFLENLGVTLKEDPRLRLRITGHTDNIGHEKFNLRLSFKRAQAIKEYLKKEGIDPSRLDIDGKGFAEPLESNETEAGRAKNRRVEISVFRSD